MPRGRKISTWFPPDPRDFDITPTMEKFRAWVEERGGTVEFDKVKIEGYWVPQVKVLWRGAEEVAVRRPTFAQACKELKSQQEEG